MKKLIIASILASAVSMSANASMESKTNFKFTGDTEFAGFCKAVLNDNVSLFKRSIRGFVGPLGATRQDVLKRVLKNENVSCAGQGLVEFTKQRDAKQVAEFISTVSI
jgi:hypothetical protein